MDVQILYCKKQYFDGGSRQGQLHRDIGSVEGSMIHMAGTRESDASGAEWAVAAYACRRLIQRSPPSEWGHKTFILLLRLLNRLQG